MATIAGVAGLVSYVKTRFNSTLNMVAVGTGTSTAGVVFNWMIDGTPAPNVAEFWRILPNENWKDAVGLWGLDASDPMAQEIFAAIENLKSTVGWHPPWNDDALVGQIIPYSKHNTNITFTPPPNYPKTYPRTSTGQSYAVDQAAPWDYTTHTYFPPDMTVSHGTGLNPAAIDETLFQAMNFYLRNDPGQNDVKNLQDVANIAVKNPDGSIGFGTAPFRGMYLGVFVLCASVIGEPNLPGGITIQDIENTIWGLQQSDGGIARQYSNFTTGVLNSDDETTNAALLAFSPGAVQYLKSVRASNIYNLASLPSSNPTIAPVVTGGRKSTALSISASIS